MRKIPFFSFALIVFLSTTPPLFPLDPYNVIETLIPSDNQPRVLNSDDLSQISLWTPIQLLTPCGDFNKDGNIEDIIISGVFDLIPQEGKKYFLLVATKQKSPSQFKELFFEQYNRPIFVHLPGTTGPGDPKTQAFSTSFCINCSKGWDFFWDKKTSTFVKKGWADRRHVKNLTERKEPEIPSAESDKALRIVSQLKDVNEYIVDLKKRNGILSVKVEPGGKSGRTTQYIVKIAEKKGEVLTVFDQILVDTQKNKVLKRKVK